MKIIRASEKQYIPASHENMSDPGVWKKVLLTYQDLITGRVQMVNWAKLPVGKSFSAHFHEDMEEVFIIVSGNAQMKIDERIVEVTKGDVVVVEPKEVHMMKNIATSDVEYIVFGITNGDGSGRTINI